MNGQKAAKSVVLIKTGDTIEQIKSKYGDFEDWFARAMGVPDLVQIDVFRQQSLPAAENLAGIVITGSAAMVSAHEQWSEDTAKWLGTAVVKGIPILGVCYGHQLLAHALGGHVGPNPAGRQIGTVTAQRLESTATDPLLGYLPSSFEVQTSHLEVVLELPQGAERLATSPLDDNFAIRFADNVWGVQFHPEFSGAVMSQYLHYREQALRKEGLNPAYLLSQVTDTTQAQSVLQKFAVRCSALPDRTNLNL